MDNKYPIKVFIGSSPSEWLPAKLLEYSIISRTKKPVKITRLYEAARSIPTPKRKDCAPRTPFSFQRFLIPELCTHNGKAIYLDADMQVFADIDILWSMPMDKNQILSVRSSKTMHKPQFSVMLLDTNKLPWDIQYIVSKLDNGELTYNQLMYDFAIVEKIGFDIEDEWNSLENWSSNTKLLHYTDMVQQPWISLENPLKDIWIRELLEAIQNGFISLNDIIQQIKMGHIRPSLIEEIKSISEKTTLSLPVLFKLDKKFTPPYKQLIPSLRQRLQSKFFPYITNNN